MIGADTRTSVRTPKALSRPEHAYVFHSVKVNGLSGSSGKLTEPILIGTFPACFITHKHVQTKSRETLLAVAHDCTAEDMSQTGSACKQFRLQPDGRMPVDPNLEKEPSVEKKKSNKGAILPAKDVKPGTSNSGKAVEFLQRPSR